MKQEETMQTGQRNLPVDCAKSLAICFVLLIHTSADVLRGGAVGSLYWLEGLFWNSLSRGAVPLFLLCSGALFLDPDRPVTARHIWRRNIPHLLLALAFWALAYQFAPYVTRGLPRADELRENLLTLLRGRQEGHLYFLTIMLLVYAALPVTRAFCVRADEKALRYALGFWLVTGVLLPTAKSLGLFRSIQGIILQWPLPLAWACIGCTVLGGALDRRPLRVRPAACMAIGGWLICFVGTWLLSRHAGTLQTQLLEGLSPGPCMLAAGLFSLCVQRASGSCRRSPVRRSVSILCTCLCCVCCIAAGCLRGFAARSCPFRCWPPYAVQEAFSSGCCCPASHGSVAGWSDLGRQIPRIRHGCGPGGFVLAG